MRTVTVIGVATILLLASLLTSGCGSGDGDVEVDGEAGQDGVDGSTGVDGQPGADGRDGEDGETGEPGANGIDGVDGVAADNTWIDPISGDVWMGGMNAVYSAAEAACTGDWRLGTETEVLLAARRGLGVLVNTLSTPSTSWTSTSNAAGEHQYIQTLQSTPSATNSLDSVARGTYCLQEAQHAD